MDRKSLSTKAQPSRMAPKRVRTWTSVARTPSVIQTFLEKQSTRPAFNRFYVTGQIFGCDV